MNIIYHINKVKMKSGINIWHVQWNLVHNGMSTSMMFNGYLIDISAIEEYVIINVLGLINIHIIHHCVTEELLWL